jgi:hypothetical protein
LRYRCLARRQHTEDDALCILADQEMNDAARIGAERQPHGELVTAPRAP